MGEILGLGGVNLEWHSSTVGGTKVRYSAWEGAERRAQRPSGAGHAHPGVLHEQVL